MMDDPHIGFVAFSYVAGVLIVGAMIVGVLRDHRKLKQTLARFADRDQDA